MAIARPPPPLLGPPYVMRWESGRWPSRLSGVPIRPCTGAFGASTAFEEGESFMIGLGGRAGARSVAWGAGLVCSIHAERKRGRADEDGNGIWGHGGSGVQEGSSLGQRGGLESGVEE